MELIRSQDLDSNIFHIKDALARGELIVVPTDTVYGIAANPRNNAAVERLLTAKGRGREYPSPVLIGSMEDVPALVKNISPVAELLMRQLWPGALTLVLDAVDGLGWDIGETNGTIALRMPAHPALLKLLRHSGPLAVTSANLHGKPAATTVEGAVGAFGNKVAVYVDDGTSPGGVSSTILRCTNSLEGDRLEVLREGAISTKEIAQIDGVKPGQLEEV